MQGDTLKNVLTQNENLWQSYCRQLGYLDLTLLECLPDFLIISPPKTATTWLTKNLGCHPDIFMPEAKEIRYFCIYWKCCDINWYLKHFQGATNLKKGEASPSYGLLPSRTIRLIRLLMPNLKLIFLMRDPIARAWSHTRHSYKYNAGSFLLQEYKGNFNDISDQRFIEDFIYEGSLYHGDYLSNLKHWLSFFPKEQFYVGFYESIKNNPKKLLLEIFNHLGVREEVEWSQFPISEKVLASEERGLSPNLELYLRTIYNRRIQELALFLKKEFDLDLPFEWTNSLRSSKSLTPVLVQDYNGFNILLFEGRFYALSEDIELTDIDSIRINNYEKAFKCVAGNSIEEAKYLADQLLFLQTLPEETRREIMASNLDTLREEFVQQRLEAFTDIELSNRHLLIENYKGFNILYKGKFYALAAALADIDPAKLDEYTLDSYQQRGQYFMATSLDEIRQTIDQFIDHISPELVEESYYRFNIVRYRGIFYALAQALGPVDLTQLDKHVLSEYQKSSQCFMANSAEEVKGLVSQRMYQILQEELSKRDEQIETLQRKVSELRPKRWLNFSTRQK